VAASAALVGVPRPVIFAPDMARLPVMVSPVLDTFVAIELVTVVAKLGSSPRAAASSFSVSSVPGAVSIKLLIDVST